MLPSENPWTTCASMKAMFRIGVFKMRLLECRMDNKVKMVQEKARGAKLPPFTSIFSFNQFFPALHVPI